MGQTLTRALAAPHIGKRPWPVPGPQNTLADIEGLTVGCAEDAARATGVTVIVPQGRAVCGVDVRGGGPGTRETDALAPENLVDAVDAIVLSGGSVYGLGAADGVVGAMGAEGKGFGAQARFAGVPKAPIVPAAILFDLANGGDKTWGDAPPYADLGRRAYAARRSETPLGNAGAGYGALAGALKGGQGAASIVAVNGVTVAALACVNCWGSVVMPDQRAFWAAPFEIDGEYGGVAPDARAFDAEEWGLSKTSVQPRGNTTLAVVATDVALTPAESEACGADGVGWPRARDTPGVRAVRRRRCVRTVHRRSHRRRAARARLGENRRACG